MRKALVLSLIAYVLMVFAGCASNGMAVNTISDNKVDRYFHKGIVTNQKKVVIDDRETAILTGAGVGGASGALIGRDVKGAGVGAVVGGIMGAMIGKEIIAYETTIRSENKNYKGYLKQRLPNGTAVEFTIKNKKLKNVNVVPQNSNVFTEEKQPQKIVKKSTPEVRKNIIIKKDIFITKRVKKTNLWYYKLADGTVLHSYNYYPYRGDLVHIEYSKTTKQITAIKLLKSYTRAKKQPQMQLKKIPKENIEVQKPLVKKEVVKQEIIQEEVKLPKKEIVQEPIKKEVVKQEATPEEEVVKKDFWAE